MLMLSITPMDMEHIDEICEDLRLQQEQGISDCAMLTAHFEAEGTPPVSKGAIYGKLYRKFREKLEPMGVRSGVLVQSTLGHIYPPNVEHPFQKVVSLVSGTKYDVCKPYNDAQLKGNEFQPMCCPYDKAFQAYMKDQMRILAQEKPSVIMVDDDMGLLYRIGIKGCCCPLHMAEFNRRAGTNMTRQELIGHVFGDSPEDKRYAQIFIDIQGDSLVQFAKAMREGIDSVDPTIQGAVSTAGNYCEFTEDIAAAFAGPRNPRIARLNNGNFGAAGARWFSMHMLRAATQRNHLKNKIDIFLAETDTCAHNRYFTSASSLHSHMTGSILEGTEGAKHWITAFPGSTGYHPGSGSAYRRILAKNRKFYEALAMLTKELKPVGCRIPLSKTRDFPLRVPNIFTVPLSGWGCCVLERYGLPLYFSAESGGAVFLDDDAGDKFTHEELTSFFKGTCILSAKAALDLGNRGFLEFIGVKVEPWNGKTPTRERIPAASTTVNKQQGIFALYPLSFDVKVDSIVIHVPDRIHEESLFPGTTIFRNSLGGTSIVFCGTPDTPYGYATASSFLNAPRKNQIISMLKDTGNLPIYYPGDMEVYMRAGYLPDNTLLCALFNIGLDCMEEITLVCEKEITSVQMLTPEGTRKFCSFYVENSILHVQVSAGVLMPVVLFLS